jgi:hypothetical protein
MERIYARTTYVLFLFVIGFLLLNFTSPEKNIEGEMKQKISFYGTLITWQGETYEVDNIGIGGKYRQIPVYDRPLNIPHATLSPDKEREIKLPIDPRKDLITTKVDLAEIHEIRTPTPEIVWKYRQKKHQRVYEFVEIEITSNGKNRTKRSYLIEKEIKLTCDEKDEKDEAGRVEKVVPMTAIKQLIVEGSWIRGNIVSSETKNTNSSKLLRQ